MVTCSVCYIDGYTTDDIIFQWITTSVTVGNDEMAQFEYISNKLGSSVDQFSVGKQMENSFPCLL